MVLVYSLYPTFLVWDFVYEHMNVLSMVILVYNEGKYNDLHEGKT